MIHIFLGSGTSENPRLFFQVPPENHGKARLLLQARHLFVPTFGKRHGELTDGVFRSVIATVLWKWFIDHVYKRYKTHVWHTHTYIYICHVDRYIYDIHLSIYLFLCRPIVAGHTCAKRATGPLATSQSQCLRGWDPKGREIWWFFGSEMSILL